MTICTEDIKRIVYILKNGCYRKYCYGYNGCVLYEYNGNSRCYTVDKVVGQNTIMDIARALLEENCTNEDLLEHII